MYIFPGFMKNPRIHQKTEAYVRMYFPKVSDAVVKFMTAAWVLVFQPCLQVVQSRVLFENVLGMKMLLLLRCLSGSEASNTCSNMHTIPFSRRCLANSDCTDSRPTPKKLVAGLLPLLFGSKKKLATSLSQKLNQVKIIFLLSKTSTTTARRP